MPHINRIPAFVFAVALGNLLVPLNSTMIVVALPLIGRDLGADHVTVAWLVTSYLIAMAALQPIAGRLGDRFGRRRFMLGALMYFIVASVGAALAPNLLVLVAFRLQQAIAAAAVGAEQPRAPARRIGRGESGHVLRDLRRDDEHRRRDRAAPRRPAVGHRLAAHLPREPPARRAGARRRVAFAPGR